MISLNIFPKLTDLSAFNKDGEVLVGYGLRTKAGATATNSFQEMVDNDRFSIIWVVGAQRLGGNMICLKVIEVQEIGIGYTT